MSHAFQQELRFPGIESSPSFVKAPEGNGVAERFIRTLKEQLLWVRTFDTVEELRQALLEFKDRFNRHWLLQQAALLCHPNPGAYCSHPNGRGGVNFAQFSVQDFGGFTSIMTRAYPETRRAPPRLPCA